MNDREIDALVADLRDGLLKGHEALRNAAAALITALRDRRVTVPEGTLSMNGNDVTIMYSSRDDAEAAFATLEASLTEPAEAVRDEPQHSEKLKAGLESVVKSLKSRPVELRGPFKSSLTEPTNASKPEADGEVVAYEVWSDSKDEWILARDSDPRLDQRALVRQSALQAALERAEKAERERDELAIGFKRSGEIRDGLVKKIDAMKAKVLALETAVLLLLPDGYDETIDGVTTYKVIAADIRRARAALAKGDGENG